jgi:putative inorganic carbon (hco3(-)) transporter
MSANASRLSLESEFAMLTLKNNSNEILAALFGVTFLFVIMLGMEDPRFIILTAILPIAAVYFFKNTFILCLMFIIFSFFRIHEAYIVLEPFKIPSMLAMSTLTFLAWKIGVDRSIQPYWRKELNAFFIFFCIVTLGCLMATNREQAFNYWNATYVKIAVMVVAIAWLARTPKDFAISSIMFVGAGITIGLVAISNKLNGIGLVEGTRVTIARDIKSVLGDPNDLALVLLFPLSFAMSMVVVRTSRFTTMLGIAGSGIILWAILATQSRGGLLGFLAVSGVMGSRVIKSKTVLITLGVLAMLVLLAAAGISKRSSGGAGESGIDESSMGRIHAWTAALGMAKAKPITGVGLDNFVINYFAYTPHWDGKNHAVHSTWFGVLAETGLPGLISFFFMLFVLCRSIYLADKKLNELKAPATVRATSLALIAGIVGFCTSASFLTQGFSWPFYILLALTIAVGKYADDFEQNQA